MKFLKNNIGGIVGCLLEILVGILLLMNPVGFTSGIIIGAGIVLLFTGLVSIIEYFRAEPEEAAKGQMLVKGLVALLAGAFCTFKSGWFVVTFPVITLIYGVVILLTGLLKVQWMMDTFRMKKGKWFLAGLSALISIACGVVIITSPFSSTAVLWMFTGISLIVEAIFDAAALIFGNRESKAVHEKEEPESAAGEVTEE
ncbi:MAG: DUF308 domain-containing protein [Lachnospiraceae bacterium]|nr:DUF308 domain-containing protein [Lachnospiraceae bacterium]